MAAATKEILILIILYTDADNTRRETVARMLDSNWHRAH